MNNRAVGGATAILNFFLALIVGGVCSWVVVQITTPIMNLIDYSQYGATANNAGTYLETLVTHQPTLMLFIALTWLVATGIYERSMLGI